MKAFDKKSDVGKAKRLPPLAVSAWRSCTTGACLRTLAMVEGASLFHPTVVESWTRDVRRTIWAREVGALIVSCGDKRTRRFAAGETVREFDAFRRQAENRLAVLRAATSIDDLRALPLNRLEVLHGDRTGQWSVGVNLQWRLCFEWPAGASGPMNVELVDYH